MEIPSAYSYVKKSTFARRPAGLGTRIPVSRAAAYGYSNARVSAMKSLLLKREFLGELARVGSVDAVVEQLERTYYKDNLVKLSLYYRGSDLVQVATSLHFAEIVNKLERITPDGDRKAFHVMLTKWDVTNAKAILNARRIGKKYEDVAPYLFPIGSFTEQEVKDLLSIGGDSIFVKFTRTHLGKRVLRSRVASSALLEKLFSGMGTADVVRLEALLDIFYYSLYSTTERLAAKDLQPIAKAFRKDIDAKNASVIVRLKQHGIEDPKEMEKYFIKGGLKGLAAFVPLMEARGTEEALKAAAKLFELKITPTDTVKLETMLNAKLAQMKVRAFYASVLSVGTILGFLFIKEEEINNLRKIAVGKEFGMTDEKISGMLVLPS